MDGKKLKVTLTRSTIRKTKRVKDTVRSLGLRKIDSSRVHDDNPTIRGMIAKVSHMVKVEEVQESAD